MHAATNVVERAFQVAGGCATLDEIRRTLRNEGFAQVDAHLAGRMICGELQRLLATKKAGGLTPASSRQLEDA